MIASVVNAVLVLIGSALGMLFKSKIKPEHSKAVFTALGLCVAVIGITGAIGTNNMLCVIISMVIGTIIGELLKIEDRISRFGDFLKNKMMKGRGTGRFTEGFMSASLLFCVGSMAIMGSIDAGINGDYSILLSKSAMDGITAVTLSAAMGAGVMFSAVVIIVYQGAITLLAAQVGPYLSEMVITEMSAVGGLLIMALAINMLLGDNGVHIKAGNMLPAIFLPVAYIPLASWITGMLA